MPCLVEEPKCCKEGKPLALALRPPGDAQRGEQGPANRESGSEHRLLPFAEFSVCRLVCQLSKILLFGRDSREQGGQKLST